MSAFIDISGKRFGRLLVIKRDKNSRTGSARWLCRCVCGSEKVVTGGQLRSGDTQSCGCLNREKRAARAKAQRPRATEARQAKSMSRAERAQRVKEQKQAYHKRWYRDPANREKIKQRSRAHYLKKKFGLTPEEYDGLLLSGCAICGRRPPDVRLELDHNHRNGKIRAALCKGCNSGLGQFQDKTERLRAAASYLEKMP